MLRENKAMVLTCTIFITLLIFGAWLLRADRTAGVPVAYVEEPDYETDVANGSTTFPTGHSGRQPLTGGHDISACDCLNPYLQPLRSLSPPRNRKDPVQVADIHANINGNQLLETDGSMWEWGFNDWGQPGGGTRISGIVPVHVLDSVVAIMPGGNAAIRADGSLWAWGAVRPDAGHFSDILVMPRHILDDVVMFYQDRFNDFAIRSDGSLWAWEYHVTVARQFEMEHMTSGFQSRGSFVPCEDAAPVHVLDSVVRVELVNNIAFAKQCNGSLWALWGTEAVHVMDMVRDLYVYEPPFWVEELRPYIFAIQTDGSLWSVSTTRDLEIYHLMDDVATVYWSGESNFVIKTDGSLWGWGNNSIGQLGDGTTTGRPAPVHIKNNVLYVHRGLSATFAITKDGGLWAWGFTSGYTSRDGSIVIVPAHISTPTQIFDDVKAVYEVSGTIFALRTDGQLWAWWQDWRDADYNAPSLLMSYVADLYVGNDTIIVIGDDGSLWQWGDVAGTARGVIGGGTSLTNISYAFSYSEGATPPDLGYFSNVTILPSRRQLPFMVTATDWWPETRNIIREHFLVDHEARLWTWKGNITDRLGDNVYEYRIPDDATHIMDAVVQVISCGLIAYALQENGDLWAWGDQYGSTPYKIMSNVTALFATPGSRTLFALQFDNSLWGWGSNWHGLLGATNHGHRVEPVQIMEQVVYFYTNGSVCFAIQTDGSLWTWGASPMGLLGNGTAERRRTFWSPTGAYNLPNLSKILEHVASIHVQGNSALAIQTDGSLWAWGDNSAGQLGDGARTNSYIPVLIMDGVGFVRTNGVSTFATRLDGSLWSWGWNAQGQLGDGTTISRMSPVRIDMDPLANMYLSSGITFATKYDNSLWAWGSFSKAPVRIMCSVAYVVTFSINRHFVLQIDGSLWELGSCPSNLEFIMGYVAAVHTDGGVHYAILDDGDVLSWGGLGLPWWLVIN